MGKIRTRTIGLEEVEEKQKKEQKEKAEAKKAEKETKKKKSKALEELKAVEAKDKVEEGETKETVQSPKSTESAKSSVSPKSSKKKVEGKKHKAAQKKVDGNKLYSVEEAVKLLKEIKYAGFDESVELHLNVEETGLKGEVELPYTTGKTVRVKIVSDDVIANLDKGVIDFDVLITHPSFMPKLAKFARVLGPKGLMPNPKAGTISPNPEEVAKKFEKGTLRWKTEAKFPIVHQMIGKISHEDKALVENANVFLDSVNRAKIKEAFIKTTMSPSIKINLT